MSCICVVYFCNLKLYCIVFVFYVFLQQLNNAKNTPARWWNGKVWDTKTGKGVDPPNRCMGNGMFGSTVYQTAKTVNGALAMCTMNVKGCKFRQLLPSMCSNPLYKGPIGFRPRDKPTQFLRSKVFGWDEIARMPDRANKKLKIDLMCCEIPLNLYLNSSDNEKWGKFRRDDNKMGSLTWDDHFRMTREFWPNCAPEFAATQASVMLRLWKVERPRWLFQNPWSDCDHPPPPQEFPLPENMIWWDPRNLGDGYHFRALGGGYMIDTELRGKDELTSIGIQKLQFYFMC